MHKPYKGLSDRALLEELGRKIREGPPIPGDVEPRPEGRGAAGTGEIEHWAGDVDHGALGEIEAAAKDRPLFQEEEPEIRGSGVGLHGMQISLPESRSVLRIAPDGPDVEVMRIESPHPFPGPLRRLVYWVVLGWVWERPK